MWVRALHGARLCETGVMARMLYYPTVTPPREIIQQAVLYWDRLILICPRDYEFIIEEDPELKFLRAQGFLELVDPLTMEIPHFKEKIFSRVLNTEKQLHASEDREEWLPIIDDIAPEMGYVWPDWQRRHLLAGGKFGGPIERALIKSKLAIPVAEDSDVLIVSARVQAALMSVGARAIASHLALSAGVPSRGFKSWTFSGRPIDGSRMRSRINSLRRWDRGLVDRMVIPQTDQVTAHTLACLWAAPDFHHRSAWILEIGALLPVPMAEVAVDELLSFRRNNDRECRLFMRTLNSFLLELQTSSVDPRLVLLAFKKRLENAIGNLESAARSRRISIGRRYATATVAAGAAYLASRPDMQELSWVLGLVTGVAINIASTSLTQPYHEDAAAFEYLIRAGLELGTFDPEATAGS